MCVFGSLCLLDCGNQGRQTLGVQEEQTAAPVSRELELPVLILVIRTKSQRCGKLFFSAMVIGLMIKAQINIYGNHHDR